MEIMILNGKLCRVFYLLLIIVVAVDYGYGKKVKSLSKSGKHKSGSKKSGILPFISDTKGSKKKGQHNAGNKKSGILPFITDNKPAKKEKGTSHHLNAGNLSKSHKNSSVVGRRRTLGSPDVVTVADPITQNPQLPYILDSPVPYAHQGPYVNNPARVGLYRPTQAHILQGVALHNNDHNYRNVYSFSGHHGLGPRIHQRLHHTVATGNVVTGVNGALPGYLPGGNINNHLVYPGYSGLVVGNNMLQHPIIDHNQVTPQSGLVYRNTPVFASKVVQGGVIPSHITTSFVPGNLNLHEDTVANYGEEAGPPLNTDHFTPVVDPSHFHQGAHSGNHHLSVVTGHLGLNAGPRIPHIPHMIQPEVYTGFHEVGTLPTRVAYPMHVVGHQAQHTIRPHIGRMSNLTGELPSEEGGHLVLAPEVEVANGKLPAEQQVITDNGATEQVAPEQMTAQLQAAQEQAEEQNIAQVETAQDAITQAEAAQAEERQAEVDREEAAQVAATQPETELHAISPVQKFEEPQAFSGDREEGEETDAEISQPRIKFHKRKHSRHHHHIVKAKCSPNPCENGGACTALEHGYDCACLLGFKGLHCEQQNHCQPNPCQNNGNCYELSSGYQCQCQNGFHGDICQMTPVAVVSE